MNNNNEIKEQTATVSEAEIAEPMETLKEKITRLAKKDFADRKADKQKTIQMGDAMTHLGLIVGFVAFFVYAAIKYFLIQ